MADVSALMRDLTARTAAVNARTDAVVARITAEEAAMQKQIEARTEAAAAGAGERPVDAAGTVLTPAVVDVRQQAAQQAQDVTIEQIISMGGDVKDPNSAISTLSAELPKAEAAKVAAIKQLADNDATKFVDAPVKVAYHALIGRAFDAQQAESAAAYAQAVGDGITVIRAKSQDVAVVSGLLQKNITEATRSEAVKAAQARIDEYVANTKLGGIKETIDIFSRLNALDQQQLNNISREISTEIDTQRLALAHQQAQREAYRFNLEKASAQEQQDLANIMKAGSLQLLGRELPIAPGVAFKLAQSGNELYKTILEQGIMSTATGGKVGEFLGTDATTVASKFIALPEINLGEAHKDTTLLFKNAIQDAKTKPQVIGKDNVGQPTLNPADPKQLAMIVGKRIENVTAQMRADLSAGDSSNIYSYKGSVDSLVAAVPTLGKSEFYTKVIAPAKPTKFDINEMYQLGEQAAARGDVTLAEVQRGIWNFANTAKTIQNATKNYEGLGLKPLQGYNARIQTTGIFGSPATSAAVDHTDYNAVGKTLLMLRKAKGTPVRQSSDIQFVSNPAYRR